MGGVRCVDSIRLDGWSEMYGLLFTGLNSLQIRTDTFPFTLSPLPFIMLIILDIYKTTTTTTKNMYMSYILSQTWKDMIMSIN